MQILQKQEWEKIELHRPPTHKLNTEVYNTAAALEIDEGFLIRPEEWRANIEPGKAIYGATNPNRRKNFEKTKFYQKFAGKNSASKDCRTTRAGWW